ncbi:hypothetical protein L7F22_048498 [Adiantum nelumboides]|nr:hypothetical protein [Adiantum nelumboides]
MSDDPSYCVLLGRCDSLTANRSLANEFLPGFNFNVSNLINNFANIGLFEANMVVLSGAHTIDKANCNTFAARLTSNVDDPIALEVNYRECLIRQCPVGATSNAFVDLDGATPTLFENGYYSNLLASRGLLHSDQVLYSTAGPTCSLVERYANSKSALFADFSTSMIKMGNIAPLVGSTQGEVRARYGFTNS